MPAMASITVREIVERVTRRAQRQGFIVAREIREELTEAGLSEDQWKEVVALAKPALSYRRGRYYYTVPVTERVRQEQTYQHGLQQAVQKLIRQYRASASQVERREQNRIDFIQPVKVFTEDQRQFTLLSRDLSPTGIRLISTRRFLGQKLRVLIPGTDPAQPWTFWVRILWTCAVGDDLFENGGTFLELENASE
jgi:PilZ domain